MELNCTVSVPVTLNCWKHHAGFIRKQIKYAGIKKITEAELKRILLVICESQMDLYLGKLTPDEIVNDVIHKLKTLNIFHIGDYKKWLSEEEKEYRLLEISDKSVWTLRWGMQKERYVHIHPGRYSPLTIRVKALTLKTTIVAITLANINNNSQIDLNFINNIRKTLLNTAPLKSLSSSAGLGRLMDILK